MDAGDLIRMRKGQATLAGFNSVLQKQGLSASTSSGCCGYFNASNCAGFPSPKFNPSYTRPSPVIYSTYEYRQQVQEGLVVNGCVPTQTVQMAVQQPVICPSVIVTVPVNASPHAILPIS
jgi:hypothetical protein